MRDKQATSKLTVDVELGESRLKGTVLVALILRCALYVRAMIQSCHVDSNLTHCSHPKRIDGDIIKVVISSRA